MWRGREKTPSTSHGTRPQRQPTCQHLDLQTSGQKTNANFSVPGVGRRPNSYLTLWTWLWNQVTGKGWVHVRKSLDSYEQPDHGKMDTKDASGQTLAGNKEQLLETGGKEIPVTTVKCQEAAGLCSVEGRTENSAVSCVHLRFLSSVEGKPAFSSLIIVKSKRRETEEGIINRIKRTRTWKLWKSFSLAML